MGCNGRRPLMRSGAQPLASTSSCAPIKRRGSAIRSIGRVRRESSPMIVAAKRLPGKDTSEQAHSSSGVLCIEALRGLL